jgi:hypothetical protein
MMPLHKGSDGFMSREQYAKFYWPTFKKDLIDYCGRDGGYILCPGTQIDDGQEEIVRAMVDFTKEYGV